MITLPELRGEQAGARADEGERDLEAGVVERHVERREHHDRADADRDQPELRDGARRAPAGDPRAQQREDEHRHRQRQQALAGLERVEAQHDLQVHGDDEEGAHEDELLADQRREPRPQLRDAAAASVSSSWSRPRRARRCSHAANAHSSASPPSTMNGTGEKPSGVISVPLIVGGVRGWTKPHTLLRRIANTTRPRPADESATPTMSSCGRRSAAGARAICPRSEQDDDHDDGLAGEHVAPRELRRHPAADQRARGDRDGGDARRAARRPARARGPRSWRR